MARTTKPRLGRGLSSLIGTPVDIQPPEPPDSSPTANPATAPPSPTPPSQHDQAASEDTDRLVYLPLDTLEPNPHQPRQQFDPASLDSLAQSIAQDGLMQPVVVRPAPHDPARYQIVAGERRWRAAQRIELARLPAIIRDLSDQQLAEWALIENLQRQDLDPIERARAFAALAQQFNLSHEQIAQRVGIERPTVSNTLRLLELHDDIQNAIRNNRLSAGHGRALLGISDPDQRLALGQRAMAAGWSVRMLESAVRRAAKPDPDPASQPNKPAHLADLEQQVADQLGARVTIKPGRRKGSGTLTIAFSDLDHFDNLLNRMGINLD